MIKKIYTNIIPLSIRNHISLSIRKFLIKTLPYWHKHLENKLKHKEKINIIIFMKLIDSWKADSVYKAFEKHKRYNINVAIAPLINSPLNERRKIVKDCQHFCEQKGYKYIKAYDKNYNSINIKKHCKIDIIIFTGPNNSSGDKLYIKHFLNKLTCYIPYSFRISSKTSYDFNNELVNLTWLNFYESKIHKELAIAYGQNKGKNVIITGFPFIDTLKSYKSNNIDKTKKTIIWAPHWTIKGYQSSGLDWSCFLEYSSFILEMAEKYKDSINFVMKPHPKLYNILKNENLWGKQKTQKYFDKWNNLSNCSITNGDYKSLFAQADALIHDSGSFMTEFIVFDKPMAYTINDKSIDERFNKFGKILINAHEKISSQKEMNDYIVRIIHNKDLNQQKRNEIINSINLTESAGEKIVGHINKKLS